MQEYRIPKGYRIRTIRVRDMALPRLFPNDMSSCSSVDYDVLEFCGHNTECDTYVKMHINNDSEEE